MQEKEQMRVAEEHKKETLAADALRDQEAATRELEQKAQEEKARIEAEVQAEREQRQKAVNGLLGQRFVRVVHGASIVSLYNISIANISL